MNDSILATIARAEEVLAALHKLSELPEAAGFYFSGPELSTSLLQFFPRAGEHPNGNREVARNLARALGGRWEKDDDNWVTRDPRFPGLERTKIILHYIEPKRTRGDEVDLSDPTVESQPVEQATQRTSEEVPVL